MESIFFWSLQHCGADISNEELLYVDADEVTDLLKI